MSLVNGSVGDHLEARGNALHTPLGIYHRNEKLEMTRAHVRAAYPGPTTRLCVLVHGLGCHEGVWRFREGDESYGSLLARDLGFTPVLVRYNTGLPVQRSGAALSLELSRLLRVYPVPVQEIVCVGHSMGGLVIRSACRHATASRLGWVRRVTRVFYLGTPHDGADLERATHVVERVLRAAPSAVARLVADVLACRSAGIKDLRHGDTHDTDVAADVSRPASRRPGRRQPRLEGARHYLVTGTISADVNHPASVVLGDGLVRHRRRSAGVASGQTHTRTFPGIGHLALANHPEVYGQIRRWCEEP